MLSKLINPFHFVAGFKSLQIGLSAIVLTAIIGYFSHTHFPDIISVKVGVHMPIVYFLGQGVVNWFIFATLLWLASLILSGSSIRAIDIYGTQASARLPYLLAAFAGFSGSLQTFSDVLLHMAGLGEPVDFSIITLVLAGCILVILLLLTIWMVALMYNGYRISANLNGTKLNLSFIVCFVLSLVLSGLVSHQLFSLLS